MTAETPKNIRKASCGGMVEGEVMYQKSPQVQGSGLWDSFQNLVLIVGGRQAVDSSRIFPTYSSHCFHRVLERLTSDLGILGAKFVYYPNADVIAAAEGRYDKCNETAVEDEDEL